jgi:F-type H+-transporting ATPase subunit c
MSLLRLLGKIAFVAGIILLSVSPCFAADSGSAASPFYGTAMGAGLGAALTIIGAAYGFGKIGSAALESMARQPEVADKVGGNMITIAALLEGATFFALIVCILIVIFNPSSKVETVAPAAATSGK